MARSLASSCVRPPTGVALGCAAALAAGVFTALAALGSLTAAGAAAGAAFLAGACALVARAARRAGEWTLGPAGSVTLARTVLVAAVAGLVAEELAPDGLVATPVIVVLTALALALDAVDGPVARRSRTQSSFGARFDMEVDAALLAVLSVHVATWAGAWVLAVGGLRYVFVAAGWVWPWLGAPLPVRYSAKAVAALQGVALVVATADVLPRPATVALVAAALVALVWSFGHSVVWLVRHARPAAAAATPAAPAATAAPPSGGPDRAAPEDGEHGELGAPAGVRPRSPARRAGGAVLTAAAALVVTVLLLAPRDLALLEPPAFVRLPVEAIVGLALLLLLPGTLARRLALAAGAVLGLLGVLTLADLYFSVQLARPFDLVRDLTLFANGYEFVAGALGPAGAVAAAVGLVVALTGLVVLVALAVRRVVRAVARRRRTGLRALAVAGGVWIVALVTGATVLPGVPLAAAATADAVRDRAVDTVAGIAAERAFAVEAGKDPYRGVPGTDLLGALRGKDVVVVVVESYGRTSFADPELASAFVPGLDAAGRRLAAQGWGARSGWLTSSVAGSGSWLASATLLSGAQVDNDQRYRTLTGSDRVALPEAFRRAGWETVAVQPGTTRAWPEGAFYGFDRTRGADDLGYRGPAFSWATMPDQFVLDAVSRLETGRPGPPRFTKVDLVSSHMPWTPQPVMVPWSALGDGSGFAAQSGPPAAPDALLTTDPERLRADYARSLGYSLDALTQWIERGGASRGRDTVVVVVGDHQPSPRVTGPDAGRDVPVTVLARDPAVLARTAPWAWSDGIRPAPGAPVWPMRDFRDRVLETFR